MLALIRKTLNPENISAAAEAVALLQRGLRARQTHATRANAASSRSHCIFAADITLHVLQGGAPQTLSSTLTLVDLAGDHTTAVCYDMHDWCFLQPVKCQVCAFCDFA